MKYVNEAFRQICNAAVVHDGQTWYVSLYREEQQYGGPEEGGWWRTVTAIESYQEFSTREQAVAVAKQVEKFADELTEKGRREHGEQCIRECEWLDALWLDADWLPEPDGPGEYFVVVESVPGQHNYSGPDHYE